MMQNRKSNIQKEMNGSSLVVEDIKNSHNGI